MSRLLDRALAVAVARAGAPGGVRFTGRQLYFTLCRVLQPWHAPPRRPGFTLPTPVSYQRFRAVLGRAGDVPGLLPGGDAGATAIAADAPPDLFDYGLPRVLVCQHDAVAAMLRANDLHLQAACPVFGPVDLPWDPRVTAALHRAGEPTVYLLHDASLAGVEMAGQLRGGLDGVRVRVSGLRPTHAAAMHLVTGRGPAVPVAEPALEHLAGWERAWLRSGRVAEVAAVAPARLLRTLHRLVRDQARPRRQRPRLGRLRAAGYLG